MSKLMRGAVGRLLSVVLSVTLAAGSSVGSLATVDAAQAAPPEVTEFDTLVSTETTPVVVRELEENRTRTSREYLLSNGHVRVEYHNGPIHYRDSKSGRFERVDTALEEKAIDGRTVSVNKANSFRIELPKQLGSDWVSIEADGAKVSLRPKWTGRAGQAQLKNLDAPGRNKSAAEIVYPDAYAGASLEYESLADGIKETIVLDRPIDTNVFGFSLQAKGLDAQVDRDGSIRFTKTGSTEAVFRIPAPFMMDSSDPSQGTYYSDAVRYELSGTAPNYHLDVIADRAWLHDAERIYPVRIDPTVTDSRELWSENDTYISTRAGNSGTNYRLSAFNWVNGRTQSATWTEYSYLGPTGWLVSQMATRKANDQPVVGAKVHLYAAENNVAAPGVIYGRMADANTPVNLTTVTWQSYAAGEGTAVSTHNTPNVTVNAHGWHEIDVTKMVAHWQQQGTPRTRCNLRLAGGAGVHVGFRSADASTNRPVWEITYSLEPDPVEELTAAATSHTWFTETDSNNDGIADNRADSGTAGRGAVTLKWQPAQGATGYRIALHDGHAYRTVADLAGGSTSQWSTAGKGLYPTDSAIVARAQGDTTNPYLPGTGLELRDNPNALYRKIAGTTHSRTDYRFRVIPYNSQGSGLARYVTVNLANRTKGVHDDVRHTSYELGEMAGHAAAVVLDAGRVELSVTDLSIASHGPDASVSRHYSSERTTADMGGRGWRYNFQQSISGTAGGAVLDYVDEAGESHRFHKAGTVYRSPRGFAATLVSDATGSTLTFKDRTQLGFTAQGKLSYAQDANGNRTTYDSTTPGLVVITAANGQSINVTITSGKVTRATYTTTEGTRRVDYTDTSVVYHPTSSVDARTVTYAYNTANRLGSLSVADFDRAGTAAMWGFDYNTAGTPTCVRYPGYATTGRAQYLRTDIAYPVTREARITRYADVLGVQDTPVTETFRWHVTGTQSARVDERGKTWTTEHGPTLDPVFELSPMGASTRRTYDTRANVTAEYDALGNSTEYVYSAANDLTRRIDPGGVRTDYTYDTKGNLITELRDVDVDANGMKVRAETQYEYDSAGLMTRERKKLNTAGAWKETVFNVSGYAANGEPLQTRVLGVKLDSTTTQDADTVRSYNQFGELTKETDPTARATSNTYSVGGRQATSVDTAGATTTYTYDRLGNVVEQKRTSGASHADWRASTFDAMGRVLTERTYLSSTSDVERTVTTTYDASGRAVQVVDSIAGTSTSRYDAGGNLVEQTAFGKSVPTRWTYDDDGRQITQSDPATTATSSTTYDAAGNVTAERAADGEAVSYEYDERGNTVAESRPDEVGSQVTETQSYDLGDRQVVEEPEPGTDTVYTPDLADRQTTASLGGATTTSEYNVLDWPLVEVDSDNVATTRTYDAAGRLLTENVGGKTTTTTYDTAGRTHVVESASGTSTKKRTTYTYDAFGRATSEKIDRYNGTSWVQIRRITTTYDALSRPLVVTTRNAADAVVSTQTHVHAKGATTTSTLTHAYGDTSTQITINARGVENSRATTYGASTLIRTTTSRDAEDRPLAWTTGGYASNVTYNATGKLATQGGLGWSTGTSYTYHSGTTATGGSGRKISESVQTASTSARYTADYAYDYAGRLTSTTYSGSRRDYGFNHRGDIVSATTHTGANVTFTYMSPTSSRLSRSVVGAATTHYGYDSRGRRIRQGPVAGSTQVTYTWDADDRLIGYRDTGAADIEASYAYDAFGQRTSSDIRTGTTRVVSTYNYDGITLLSATIAETAAGITTNCTLAYLYDEQGRPYAALYSENGGTQQLYHLTVNDRGDVLQALNSSGSVFATYRYDAWGNAAGTTATGTTAQNRFARLQPLRYAGYCYDAGTKLYYCSQRYYDPATFQFLTKDPAKDDGEESAYQYCGGDPVGGVDPTGLRSIRIRILGSRSPLMTMLSLYKTGWMLAKSPPVTGMTLWLYFKVQLLARHIHYDKNGRVQKDVTYWTSALTIPVQRELRGGLTKTISAARSTALVRRINAHYAFWKLQGYTRVYSR